MDFSRIEKLIDVQMMKTKCVAIIGVGGGANISRNLIRSGLGRIKLIDFDFVADENICRQEHMADQIGMKKVTTLEAELNRINSDAAVEALDADICALSDVDIARIFGDVDVIIAATDNHAAQARINRIALRHNKPAVFVGMYGRGAAGEVFFRRPGLATCYRCALSARYEHFAKGGINNAEGADIFSLQMLDSVAGMIVLGLLTMGSDNRYGRLIEQLGDRQFLQVKMDPTWTLGGKDVVREQLGIPPGNDTFFSFCTIARRDPDPGGLCPDCKENRGSFGNEVNL